MMEINASDTLDRIKSALKLKTDTELAEHFKVSNRTVSSWRTRNSVPIEIVLQAAYEQSVNIETFLFGTVKERKAVRLEFADLTLLDFQLASRRILAELLIKFAPEQMTKAVEADELGRMGDDLGVTLLTNIDFIRKERKALLESGQFDEAHFEEYIRKSDNWHMPYFLAAVAHELRGKIASAKRPQGPDYGT